MGIAVSAEHLALAEAVHAFLQNQDARTEARASVNGRRGSPTLWAGLAKYGWLGLHVPEQFGGSGFGLTELAVVAEELGRQCTPGPFLPTAATAGAIAVSGNDKLRAEIVPRLVDGRLIAGFAASKGVRLTGDGLLDGVAGPVAGGDAADIVGLTVGDDLVLVDRRTPGMTISSRDNLDPTQRCAIVRCSRVRLASDFVVRGGAAIARDLFHLLVAAEAAGGAAACREMAVGYAKSRVAFGRVIGQFQAVKHHCTNMLADEQLAAAAAWQAAQATDCALSDPAWRETMQLAVTAAVAVAVPAFLRCAELNIQIHGGIGFTWEHDAQLYLRRAAALSALAGPLGQVKIQVARLAAAPGAKVRIPSATASPVEDRDYRAKVRTFITAYRALPERERHRYLVDHGYLYPDWPRPWGRGAGPVEQLVIDEELADIPRYTPLGRTGWAIPIVLPTIIAHGSQEQKRRWVTPSLLGELRWCQLLSEPSAGSDLAALTTRAERTEGGWRLTGQKVWTSSAHEATTGLALVRTDREAPRHRGLTCVAVDMTSPSVVIKPLRQLTGDEEFSEVFLDGVFVPDDDVIGEVNDGWTVIRTALSLERASLGGAGSAADEPASVSVLTSEYRETAQRQWDFIRRAALGRRDGISALLDIGDVTATDLAIRALNTRITARALAGLEPGVDGNLTKLITTSHAQRVADVGIGLLGPEGVFTDEKAQPCSAMFLQSRMATIAGGTSEILRNVVAERILGLPRDPDPMNSQGTIP